MASLGFRALIGVLEQKQRLRRIKPTVDRTWEPACLAKWVFQALPDEQRFGLLFESVEKLQVSIGYRDHREFT